MSERDSLTEWFHALAEHFSEALVGLATSENIALLRLHVSRSTPDYPLPEKFEATEFAETVTTFRENESESPIRSDPDHVPAKRGSCRTCSGTT